MAENLEALDKCDLEKLEAILEYETFRGVDALLNVLDRMDSYDYLTGVNDDYALGYYWIEESGCYDLSSMGNLAQYIDYERFGRDISLDESGHFVSGGYICSR